MKNISFKRLINLPVLFLILGILLQVASLIIYISTGVDEFNDALSKEVLTFSIITLVIGLILVVLRFLSLDELKIFSGNFNVFIYLDYVLALFAFTFYIVSKINYIVNIIVSIDGTKVSFAFVLTITTLVISFLLLLVSGLLFKKLTKKEEGGQRNEI